MIPPEFFFATKDISALGQSAANAGVKCFQVRQRGTADSVAHET